MTEKCLKKRIEIKKTHRQKIQSDKLYNSNNCQNILYPGIFILYLNWRYLQHLLYAATVIVRIVIVFTSFFYLVLLSIVNKCCLYCIW